MVQPEDRSPGEPDHRMRSTTPASLVVAVLGAAAFAWIGIDRFYVMMPPFPWLPPLTMLGLAVVEAVAGRQTRAKIERRPGAGLLEPLVIARYVVLAKASAMAGAIFTGLYVGFTSWMLLIGISDRDLVHAKADLKQAIAGTVGAVALVVAALWLERCCRVPAPPGGDGTNGGRQTTDGAKDDPGTRGR